jgi:16S rRNA (uracil1498-N3)-methyltransferase
MALFWLPATSFVVGEGYFLDAEQTTHLTKSLRIKVGAEVELTNGEGLTARAVVVGHEKQQALLEVRHIEGCLKPLPVLRVALSPLKNPDRLEWAVEKLAELGVASLTPILYERTEKPFVRLERLERIAQSALRQSGGAWLMKINPPQAPTEWLKTLSMQCKKLLPYAIDRQVLAPMDKSESIKDYALAIGPEGDFTRTELDLFQREGFSLCSLGPLRLRSETAAIAAASKIMLP